MDEKTEVVVKTPCGLTDEFTVNRSIMQGSVFGPIKSTVTRDTLHWEEIVKSTIKDCLSTKYECNIKHKNTLQEIEIECQKMQPPSFFNK